jgi:riboflavin kinase / FMN adenylyltransferase
LKIHRGSQLYRLKSPVISIGIFDGVHRGHSAVFESVRKRAAELSGESAIVTFWPHPRLVLGGSDENLRFLTTLEEKTALIRDHGIDHLFIMPFTKEFSRLPACDFVRQYLVEGAGLAHLVFGFDHHFGRGREGNFENLKTCARLYNFTLEQLEPVTAAGIRVSSSVIRDALCNGNVSLASELLSYPYGLQGTIVGGEKVGRAIGYPTANVKPGDPNKLVPADGVYAVRVMMGGKSFMGMMNIGFRPTISKVRGNKTLEVHIIDYSGNAYDSEVRIDFIDRIREEREFGTLDLLREQLEKDKAVAVRILSDD